MQHPYQCRLGFEATVPENPSIERFINFSIDSDIFCPKCDLTHNNIKKNGHDQQKRGKIQKKKLMI